MINFDFYIRIFVLLFILDLNECVEYSKVSVNISHRQINGIKKSVDGNDVNVFLGIPYAQPPIGERRFKKPLPLTHQLESYDATQWPNACMQIPMTDAFFSNKNLSEDCLYLNIWSPCDFKSIDSDALKAVMFWIHGGALAFGSGNEYLYNGDILSTVGDVVVVTINYRLSVFGFFYSGTDDAPGNVGLWDQALALQWVNDNIRYFGGDPNKITIFGESAGGWSISLQLLSPITRNMYQNAIIMSGAVVSSELIDEPIISKTKWLSGAKLIGCTDDSSVNEITPKIINCLHNFDAQSLLKMTQLKELKPKLIVVFPVIDGTFIVSSPKQSLDSGDYKNDINLLIGTTEDEGSFLLPFYYDYNKYHPISPQNLSFTESYNELINLLPYFFETPIDGEEVANVYFTEVSPNTEDYDLIRRTIGIPIGDYYLGCPTTYFGKTIFKNARKTANVFQYHFNTKLALRFLCAKWMGACHADDLWPVFGIPFLEYNKSTDAEREESLRVIEFLAHFAKHGYPSPQNGKEWPKYYSLRSNNAMIAPYFDMKRSKFRNSLKHTECELLFKKYYETKEIKDL